MCARVHTRAQLYYQVHGAFRIRGIESVACGGLCSGAAKPLALPLSRHAKVYTIDIYTI